MWPGAAGRVSVMQWIFWICAFGVLYSYLIYPVMLMLLVPWSLSRYRHL